MGQQIKVLYFIDDSDDEAFLTKLLFDVEKIDLEIEYFTDLKNFQQAYKKADLRNFIALLIVDLNMPKQNGIEIISELRRSKKYSNLVVGICTGSEDPVDKREAHAAGADFFIQKPLDKKSLQNICQLVPSLNLVQEKNGSVQIEAE